MSWELIERLVSIFGGVAAITLAFFGKSILIRIASKYNEKTLTKLEEVKTEMAFSQKSYESQLPFIVDYYTLFYEHYRSCQQYADSEIIRHPDTEDNCTKILFENSLDQFIIDWKKIEPRIRLILPRDAYILHNEVTESFNQFNRESKKLSSNCFDQKKKLRELFSDIHSIKERIELLLREYLRA